MIGLRRQSVIPSILTPTKAGIVQDKQPEVNVTLTEEIKKEKKEAPNLLVPIDTTTKQHIPKSKNKNPTLKTDFEEGGWRIGEDGTIFRKGITNFANGDCHEGEWVNGKRNGFGTHKYLNGDSYRGEYKDDLWDGQGVLHLIACFYEGKPVANFHYEGHFKKGKKDGLGKLSIDNRLEYEGEFVNDKFCGYGMCKYNDGSMYEGYYEDDKWEGEGRLEYKNGDLYKGHFVRSLFDGDGNFKWANNGGSYTGQYYRGYRHGKGVRIYANNNKCEGTFSFDCADGDVNYTFANGDIYCGPMKNNKFNGYGIFTFAKGDRYEGNFLNGMFYGKGKFIYSNGGFYQGEYNAVLDKYTHGVMFPNANGLRHGKGLRLFPNGNRYDGMWKDDKMHGEGVLTLINGEEYKGSFVDGLKDGFGVYIYGRGDESEYICPLGDIHRGKTSCSYEGYWSKDLFHGKGKLICASGRFFEGNWQYNRREGEGKMIYVPLKERSLEKDKFMKGVDGMYRTMQYSGNWKDDVPCGGGTVTYADGLSITGEFKFNGKLDGICKMTFPSGKNSRMAEYSKGYRIKWRPNEEKEEKAVDNSIQVINFLRKSALLKE